jgi:hypothetical protein
VVPSIVNLKNLPYYNCCCRNLVCYLLIKIFFSAGIIVAKEKITYGRGTNVWWEVRSLNEKRKTKSLRNGFTAN